MKELSEKTKLPLQKLEEAREKKKLQFIEWNIPYYRFKEKIEHIEKGTVAFVTNKGLELVRGFPKIPRALVISTGFKKNFEKAFAEEKMDGYNVRTVMINGKVISLTRGGLVCEYTTSRVRKLINTNFFKDNPELMLCGEVVGLQNPYQEKSYPEAKNFDYFIFDIRNRVTNKPLKHSKKMETIKKYNLKSVHVFGEFDNGKEILKLTRRIGEEGREGVVLKTEKGKMLKYTANQSTNKDLQYAFTFYSDYGLAFMYRRLVREAFQAYELGLKGKELEEEASKLGKNILIPMVETIRKIAGGEEVTEDFEIEVPDEETGKHFVENLKHLGVIATIREVKKSGNSVIMRISRHYPSTNDRTKAFLNGASWHD